jgi:hypothetical protein
MIHVILEMELKKKRVIVLLLIIFILFFSILIILNHPLCTYRPSEIERQLSETSDFILENSKNDIEKTNKIIEWENGLELSTFEDYEGYLRKSNNAKWFIHLKKANCGERAIIFEDMAKRTNLTYRSVTFDGYINPIDGEINNHRWTQVWIDNDWRIADSGFNLSYPKYNNYYFHSKRGFLIGHVAIIYDNGTFGDITDSYVEKTGKLIINAKKDNNNVKNADISITMEYKNFSCPVVGGGTIRLTTNDSGISELNLGINNNTNYTVSANYKDSFFEYYGKEMFILTNNTDTLVIELDNRKIRFETWIYFIYCIMILCFTGMILKIKKSSK